MTTTDPALAAIIEAARAAVTPRPDPATLPPLSETIRQIVRTADAGAARSQQRRIGPSEIGQECDRFIGYKMMGADPVNTGRDNWLATLGTAAHAWLEAAFRADNTAHPGRWLIEERVWLNAALSGSCDLFDTWTGTVVDHKLLGTTSLRKIKADGPPPKYRVQLHLYGYGHARAGRQVSTVALACYPRNDNLTGEFGGNPLLVWSEPWSPQIAAEAMTRLATITALAVSLDVEANPGLYAAIAAQPGPDCKYCPFFNPEVAAPGGDGCPGPTTTPPTLPDRIPGLVEPSTKEHTS